MVVPMLINVTLIALLYVIVEFPDEANNGKIPFSLVTSRWLTKEKENLFCLWPNYKNDKIRNTAVQQHQNVTNIETCPRCPVNIKYYTTNYEKACKKQSRLEIEEEVSQTENELERKRKVPPQFQDYSDLSDTDIDESDLPQPPILTKEKRNLIFGSLGAVKPKQFSRKCHIPNAQLSTALQSSPSSSRCSTPTISSCSGCFSNGVVLKRIEQDLIYIKSQILHLTRDQKEGDDVRIKPIITIKDSHQELEEFNSALNDAENMRAAVAYFKCFGGDDIGDITRRILSRMIKNCLAIAYNWTGKNGKKSINSLRNIVDLIIVSVRKNKGNEEVSEKLVEKEIKHWFSNAADRDGGRTNRKKKPRDGDN